jgi:hypothetical protein
MKKTETYLGIERVFISFYGDEIVKRKIKDVLKMKDLFHWVLILGVFATLLLVWYYGREIYRKEKFSPDSDSPWVNFTWPDCGGLNLAVFKNSPAPNMMDGTLTVGGKIYPFTAQINAECCLAGKQTYSVPRDYFPDISSREKVLLDFNGVRTPLVWNNPTQDQCTLETFRCTACG